VTTNNSQSNTTTNMVFFTAYSSLERIAFTELKGHWPLFVLVSSSFSFHSFIHSYIFFCLRALDKAE